MRSLSVVLAVIGLAVLAVTAARPALAAQPENKVDYQAVIKEMMQTNNSGGKIAILWWMPEEFWRVALAQSGSVPKAQIDELAMMFRPYIVLGVIDGKVGLAGTMTFQTEADTRAATHVVDREGKVYEPLAADQVGPEVTNLLAMMKPVLASGMGAVGQNMRFVVFAAKDAKERRIADPTKPGSFSVKVGDTEFRWKLPLGSLLPPKECPKCKEQCSGAWSFCPWCGAALPMVAAPSETPKSAPPGPEKPAPPATPSAPAKPAAAVTPSARP